MKTVEEWSHGFDLLYNNIASDKAPGLEPFEISQFLTTAQEAIVIALYKGSFGDAFESTEEVSSYLSTLVKQADCEKVDEPLVGKLSASSTVFDSPEDLLFRTWESCVITSPCGETQVPVIPVTQDEFWRTIRNPFKRQNKQRVLRLEYSVSASVTEKDSYSVRNYVELVSDYTISEYTVRYLSKPEPIIIEDLPAGLSINGKTEAQTCLLPEALHQTILSEAVRMAKATWSA